MQALVFASYGTADKEVQKRSLDAVVEDFRFEFPKVNVSQVFLSQHIREKLEARGETVPSVSLLLSMLKKDEVSEVYLQPGLIAAGDTYEKELREAVASFADSFDRIRLGEPLIASKKDAQNFFVSLLSDLHVPPHTQLVLVGHGSAHRTSGAYARLQELADEVGLPLHIGVFAEDSTPGQRDVLARLSEAGDTSVLLAPLLLTSGYHAKTNIFGDEEASWKSALERAGYTVSCDRRGLGEYPLIRKMFVNKARTLM